MIIKDGRVAIIEHKSKSYWQGEPDTICAAVGEMMKEMAAFMPPSLKEKMSPGGGGALVREDLGTATIAGYESHGYRFTKAGPPASEVWVSKDPKLSGLMKDASEAMTISSKVGGCADSPLPRWASTSAKCSPTSRSRGGFHDEGTLRHAHEHEHEWQGLV